MPADEEELLLAIEDGVEFQELLSPVKLENGRLVCRVMQLGDFDDSGRRSVIETEEIREVLADTVIAAVGEKIPTELYEANGIHVNERGKAMVNAETCETNLEGVYAVSYTHLQILNFESQQVAGRSKRKTRTCRIIAEK